jgi:DNA-binding LytR/AlgR family response regulator
MQNKVIKIFKRKNIMLTNDNPVFFFIDLAISNEIVKLESIKNYTLILFKNGNSKRFSYTLLRFEELLYGNLNYLRVNRSTIINIYFLKSIDFIENQLRIGQNNVITISRRRLGFVKKHLEKVENLA